MPHLNIPTTHFKNQSDVLFLTPNHTNIYIIWKQTFQTQNNIRKQCKIIRSMDKFGEIIVLSTKYSNKESLKLYESQAMIVNFISLKKPLNYVFSELYNTLQYIVKKGI